VRLKFCLRQTLLGEKLVMKRKVPLGARTMVSGFLSLRRISTVSIAVSGIVFATACAVIRGLHKKVLRVLQDPDPIFHALSGFDPSISQG
jgi:hypothetical protein